MMWRPEDACTAMCRFDPGSYLTGAGERDPGSGEVTARSPQTAAGIPEEEHLPQSDGGYGSERLESIAPEGLEGGARFPDG